MGRVSGDGDLVRDPLPIELYVNSLCEFSVLSRTTGPFWRKDLDPRVSHRFSHSLHLSTLSLYGSDDRRNRCAYRHSGSHLTQPRSPPFYTIRRLVSDPWSPTERRTWNSSDFWTKFGSEGVVLLHTNSFILNTFILLVLDSTTLRFYKTRDSLTLIPWVQYICPSILDLSTLETKRLMSNRKKEWM